MEHLKILENNIKAFICRYAKEIKPHSDRFNTIINNAYKIQSIIRIYLDNCKFDEEIYKDVINIILSEGEITLQILVDDINTWLEHNENYNFKKLKYDEKDVIDFMKIKLTNYMLLNAPVDHMFCWALTKSGHEMYSKINNLVNRRLNFFNRNLSSYIKECIIKYS